MSNVIELNGGIVLTLSDDVMNALFGGLLVSQVNNLQKQVDVLAMTVARLESEIGAVDGAVETLQGNFTDIESSVADLDSKFDDMPDFDEMAGQIEELESNVNADSIGELESGLETVESKVSKLDHDLDVVNGIFSAIVSAIHSKVHA